MRSEVTQCLSHSWCRSLGLSSPTDYLKQRRPAYNAAIPRNRRQCANYDYSDYEIALIVARMDSLKDRREMLMARLFKKQVLASKPYSNNCYLNHMTMILSTV